MKAFDEIFIDETKYGVKVQTSEYRDCGKYVIIDQGQNQIAGYTDREEGVFEHVPVIIFGDHTRIIKYIDEPFFLGADGVKVLSCKDNNANYKYLYYALKNAKIPDTGYNRHFKWLRKICIKYPDVDRQKEIVIVLDMMSDIIKKRKKEIKYLDDLIKARFVEMFGDPILNPNGYLKEKIEKHIDLLSGYPFKSEQYVEEGINICGGLIIMPQKIKWNECVHWSSAEGFEDYLLNENDIVMALDRPWISEGFKMAKVDAEHLPALLIQRTARIRTIDMNQEYLYYCFINGGFDKHSNVTGSLVPHISAKDIRSFEIMIPPAELQNQFADFVNQVDKLKLQVKKSLDETQVLFDSLMQQYFG